MEIQTISTQDGVTRIDRRDSEPRIRFSPFHGDTNAEASERRAAAIFGPVEICDPWTSAPPSPEQIARIVVLHGVYRPPKTFLPSSPFQLVPSEFLRVAKQRPPRQPGASASAFAQWIYSLYASSEGSDDDRESGLAAEPEILAFRHRALRLVDADYLHQQHAAWELAHCGLHHGADTMVSYFHLDDLRVNGEPLRASPDLVYRHKTTGEVIVVEIKMSRMAIPSNLWPNVWGQLWCYAQLPVVRAASRVTVVGEVWAERSEHSRGQGDDWQRLPPYLYLRASVRRDPREAVYDRFFRALFDIYRGAGGGR
ncbi:hypothetical protein OOOCML_33015 (plasmid) [Cupriavidus necator H16]|uniref:Uncharacterized protein n=1 Tax=Cupriavidus necator (strain ATCC 17699 / DSM 428 / KCTC 22496 / NCIMB 10442 / H16 / Stanier 337) TaxID=381666 RepID=Q7WXI5_CUPNH|nr:hypothetical protein [Cupriavidus necator]AAP85901.1 hypothetical protein PHG149 [Cupriavidus necator H16]QCC05393.1 hypothetical protein E6A55_32880 [Cupriavidus necator H16]QQB81562.1 hypothetical protein I6H87_32860 [Cupriavidus necator]